MVSVEAELGAVNDKLLLLSAEEVQPSGEPAFPPLSSRNEEPPPLSVKGGQVGNLDSTLPWQ